MVNWTEELSDDEDEVDENDINSAELLEDEANNEDDAERALIPYRKSHFREKILYKHLPFHSMNKKDTKRFNIYIK